MHGFWSLLSEALYWLAAFGNARTLIAQVPDPAQIPPPPPAPPTTPTTPAPAPPPAPNLPPDAYEPVDEGTTYYTDPLTLWFCYMPLLLGGIAVVAAIPFSPLVGLPIAGTGMIAITWGLLWFIFCTRMLPPVTLAIRQIVGTTYFRDCRITVFPFFLRRLLGIRWVEIPGLRDITITIGGEGVEALESYMHMTGDPTNGVPHSHVEVKFEGTFVLSIDIDRPNTVTAMFWDDFIANPPNEGASVMDDMTSRVARMIMPQVYAACDPTLQTIEWIEAVRNVTYVNRRLMNELPMRLGHLALEIESVNISEAQGVPFDELKRQTNARLKANADRNIAEAERDTRITQATAEADATIAEAQQAQAKEVARTESDRAIRIAQQETERSYGEARLIALAELTQVASREADMATAPLVARLAAINNQQSAALLDSLTALDGPQRLEVWRQLMTSLGTAPVPSTLVSIANGQGLDSFPTSAIINALQPIITGVQRAANPPPAGGPNP